MEGKEVLISEKLLENLLDTVESQKQEIRALYDGSIKVMELIGLAENGQIKESAFGEGANTLPEVLKGASSIMALVMQCQVPIIGKKAEKKLAEKFGFFSELIPLFVKYGNEFKTT